MQYDDDANDDESGPAVIPIGAARQIRVQFRGTPTLGWQRFGIYARRAQAEACVARLRAGGYSARLLDFRRTPVAG
jgi:hypothetical protein